MTASDKLQGSTEWGYNSYKCLKEHTWDWMSEILDQENSNSLNGT